MTESQDPQASSANDVVAAVVTGLRVEEVEKGVTYDDGASVVLAGTPVFYHFIN